MAGLNTAQIIERARNMGVNLSDAQAQPILSQAWNQGIFGADPGRVDELLRGMRPSSISQQQPQSQSQPVYPAPTQTAENLLAKQAADRSAFNTKIAGEGNQFLTKFRTDFPAAIKGIESELNLPSLRQTAFGAGQTLQGVQGAVRDVPQTQQTIAKQVGISAPRLQQRIGAETAKLAPTLEAATRGLTEATSAAQFAEGELGRRSQQALVPYQTELDLLKDNWSRQSTGFNQDAENQLNLLLTRIQQEGASNIATIQQATKLAELEQATKDAASKVTNIDAGDRIILMDGTGKQIGSIAKSATPSSGGGGTVIPTLNTGGGQISTQSATGDDFTPLVTLGQQSLPGNKLARGIGLNESLLEALGYR